jgi:membrane protease YdiL (CAAX protease family)
VNAVVAFGEEYGWRGFLLDEARKVTSSGWKLDVAVGTLWGLWHAPFIVQGLNYRHDSLGVPAMVVFCIGSSRLLRTVLEESGSIVGPAMVHGAMNGYAGAIAALIAGGRPILSGVPGVVGAAAAIGESAVVRAVSRRRRGRR